MINRAGIGLLAAYSLLLGAWMAVDPHSFFDVVGPFGPRNDHYTRDNATFNLALGLGLLVALRRPRWRLPLVGVALAQFVLHAINHLNDAGEAHPRAVGVLDAVSLAVGALALAWLAFRIQREEQS